MVKILADNLENNQVSSLAEFMGSASNGKFVRRGKRVEITGLTNKKVKFLLHKFLHVYHLSEYRVLDGGDTLEIIQIKPEPKRKEKPVALKHPVPYGPPIPYLSGAIRPSLQVEWQGKPPTKRIRYKSH